MSSGNDQHFFAAQEFVVQDLRKRTKRNTAVEDVFEFHISPGDGIAHHDEIGRRLEILRAKGLRHRYLKAGEKIRHRRIGRCVRTGDAETALLEHSGERSHGGAADSNQMNMLVLDHDFLRELRDHRRLQQV